MKTYDVIIRATITKTYRVEANDETEADETAHSIFDCLTEPGIPENYEEDTLEIEEVKNG